MRHALLLCLISKQLNSTVMRLDTMKVWLIDDKRENHERWLNSFVNPLRNQCELRSFYSVSTLIEVLDSGTIPDILFVDFFIGERLGTEVIRWFGGMDVRPVLIAYSSMEAANDGMVAEGADFSLAKIKRGKQTDSILRAFRSFDDLKHVVEARSIPPEQTI